LSLQARKREEEGVLPSDDLLSQAKQWYSQYQSSDSQTKSGSNPFKNSKREPDWSKAIRQKHHKADLLEMPLLYDNKYLMASYRDSTGSNRIGITKVLL
jgi:hypothetical protein